MPAKKRRDSFKNWEKLMVWLIVATVAFAAVVLWMLIETRGTLHLLWVIPICIGLITGTHKWAYSMFGYPTDDYNEGEKFTLVSFFVPKEEDQIIIWVVLKDEEIPKSIIIPYDPEEKENLQRVQAKMSEGGRFEGQFQGDGLGEAGSREGDPTQSGGGSLKSANGMLNFTELSVQSFLPPKGYLAEEENISL